MPPPKRSRRELRNRAKLALWLALPFIALMLLVSPRGDFPLNDDWVYAKMVQALVDNGHFGLSPFSNAYALTQTLYAAPLVKLFGFSFTLLRLTTIFMGWVTVCFTAFTARELGLPNRSAILAALTVFVNPLFINLSYTFMTDVPFSAFAMISTYYFVKALREPASSNLLLATLFSIGAYYNRQFGVSIPIAFVLSGMWLRSPATQAQLARTTALLIVPWVFAIALTVFVRVPLSDMIFVANEYYHPDPKIVAALMLLSPQEYLGLFLLPLIASRALKWPPVTRVSRMRIRWRWVFIWFVPLAAIGYLLVGPPFVLLFFLLPNIIEAFSFGPKLFSFYTPNMQVFLLYPVMVIVGCVSTAAFGLLLSAGVRQFKLSAMQHPPVRKAQLAFLILCGLAYVISPYLLFPAPYFDRYLLPAVPLLAVFAMFLMGYRPRSYQFYPAAIVFGMFAAWSAYGLQDYMAWNTARWRAVDILRVKYHAADTEIDGGFEFNGMYTSEEYIRRLREEPNFNPDTRSLWVINATYLISPERMLGRGWEPELLEAVPYYSWLAKTQHLYILRLEQAPGGTAKY